MYPVNHNPERTSRREQEMTEVWLYVVAASSNPDKVDCKVPWQVDEELIFFGPCKTRIRECLRRRYLSADCSHYAVHEDIFIVGVNGSNDQKCRKIIWAGKLSEVMTFAEAWKQLSGRRFQKLREHPGSP